MLYALCHLPESICIYGSFAPQRFVQNGGVGSAGAFFLLSLADQKRSNCIIHANTADDACMASVSICCCFAEATVGIMRKYTYTSQNWFAKVTAAVVPGNILTFGLVGVIGVLSHVDSDPRTASAQFLTWLTVLLWCIILPTCFLFSNGRRAWNYLSISALCVWGLFFVLRGLQA